MRTTSKAMWAALALATVSFTATPATAAGLCEGMVTPIGSGYIVQDGLRTYYYLESGVLVGLQRGGTDAAGNSDPCRFPLASARDILVAIGDGPSVDAGCVFRVTPAGEPLGYGCAAGGAAQARSCRQGSLEDAACAAVVNAAGVALPALVETAQSAGLCPRAGPTCEVPAPGGNDGFGYKIVIRCRYAGDGWVEWEIRWEKKKKVADAT